MIKNNLKKEDDILVQLVSEKLKSKPRVVFVFEILHKLSKKMGYSGKKEGLTNFLFNSGIISESEKVNLDYFLSKENQEEKMFFSDYNRLFSVLGRLYFLTCN